MLDAVEAGPLRNLARARCLASTTIQVSWDYTRG